MGAALVERALEDRIRSRIDDPDGTKAEAWFEGFNAPFGTFSAKIALGSALRLFDAGIEAHLVTLKNVRNTFAHSMIPLSFDHPTIAEEAHSLRSPELTERDNTTARDDYVTACLVLAKILGMDAILREHLKAYDEAASAERGAK
jgi:hypothetical protein